VAPHGHRPQPTASLRKPCSGPVDRPAGADRVAERHEWKRTGNDPPALHRFDVGGFQKPAKLNCGSEKKGQGGEPRDFTWITNSLEPLKAVNATVVLLSPPGLAVCRNDADTPAIASAMGFSLFIKADQGFAGSGLRLRLGCQEPVRPTERVPCRLGTRSRRRAVCRCIIRAARTLEFVPKQLAAVSPKNQIKRKVKPSFRRVALLPWPTPADALFAPYRLIEK
jgi:hypothetical protein